MLDLLKWAWNKLLDRRHLENTVEFADGFLLSGLITILLTGAYLLPHFYPAFYGKDAIFLPGGNLVCFVVFCYVAVLLCWFIGFHLYWKSGKGEKIAVHYTGSRVPMAQWCETRKRINRLIEEHKLDRAIHLRLIPERMIRSEETWKRYMEKYGFSVLFIATGTETINTGKPIINYTITANYSNLDRDFLRATQRHTEKLWAHEQVVNDLAELELYKANKLFNVLLLWISIYFVSKDRFENASTLLWTLENNIRHIFAANQHPRKAIRWLDAACISDMAHYPADQAPSMDKLTEIIAKQDVAVQRYGEQFPFVINVQARHCYFANDLQRAMELTDKALEYSTPRQDSIAYTYLNKAVLCLFAHEYANAAEYLAKFIGSIDTRNYDPGDLITFADVARANGHKPAIILQVLYRKLGRREISTDLRVEYNQWINADRSRNQLKDFFGHLRIEPQKPRNGAGVVPARAKRRKR